MAARSPQGKEEEFNSMSAEQRAPYEARAEQDAARYERQKQNELNKFGSASRGERGRGGRGRGL
jgi:hypothetical protein